MKKVNIRLIIPLLFLITFIKCSTYEYFSNNETEIDYCGEWLSKNNQSINLVVQKTENNLYGLKFHSTEGDWEAIGYEIDNELLAIFKYKYIDEKGYVTFKLITPDKLYYKSINTDGSFRAQGYYYKLKSP